MGGVPHTPSPLNWPHALEIRALSLSLENTRARVLDEERA